MRHNLDDDLNFIDVEDEKTLPVAKIIFVMIALAAVILAGAYYLKNNHNGNPVKNVMETAEGISNLSEKSDEQTGASREDVDAFQYAADQASKGSDGHNIVILPNILFPTAKEAADNLISGSDLVSSDLDFWDMYNKQQEQSSVPSTPLDEEKKEEEKKEDPSTDGKHTKLVNEDGTEEWIEIDGKIKRSTYKYENLVFQYPEMKYYEDGSKISQLGAMISENNEEVDFEAMKADGIDYVCLCLGYRGYSTGNIINDSKFFDYYNAAKEAGLDVGAYFNSQAITEEEALEEAARVVEILQGYPLDYPVAFIMEYVKNDTARITGLAKADKTKIAVKFMDGLRSNGIKTILYGNKDWLIRSIDLSLLSSYDVWYSEESDIPDYPYQFIMWEYTKKAEVRGVDEPVRLTICMVNYKLK